MGGVRLGGVPRGEEGADADRPGAAVRVVGGLHRKDKRLDIVVLRELPVILLPAIPRFPRKAKELVPEVELVGFGEAFHALLINVAVNEGDEGP